MHASKANCDDCRRDHLEVLRQSRANNGLYGVSGFIWTDGVGHLQVLEGASKTVEYIVERVRGDPRHNNTRVVSDESASTRAFGD
ncbi:BLUF domain-containing protein [uncultured Sphingomonas sp.]|uniref:BLUF domain-containing protein n=1 Tax=uncultured Sphingomonas sp. TaxID=158754 RepID=UPI0035CABFC7